MHILSLSSGIRKQCCDEYLEGLVHVYFMFNEIEMRAASAL